MDKEIAVFIDRDGTISEEIGYVNHPERFRLLPKSGEAIKMINALGLKAVVVTNQAGVARGYFPEWMIEKVHDKMEELLEKEGAKLDAIYYCPHHPKAGEPPYRADCECRKPRTGMIDSAAEDLHIDVKKSYMIGDKITDVEFAHRVGAKGIFVKTGYGRGELELYGDTWTTTPDFIAEDLLDAVIWIRNEEEKINAATR
ncbi:MAG: HAD family hydrolase [Deltaproteobacteria bacterium]|nr:HAD family hydrolase [Deltaproteobacteria bacterium]